MRDVDRLGVEGYLRERGVMVRHPPRIEVDSLVSRLRYHSEERVPFYVKLLEERAAAREKGLLNPFDSLLSYSLPEVPLSAVPANALMRLSQIGSADLMFPRLFKGEPGDGFLGWGVCSLQAASVEDPAAFRNRFVERASSLEGAELAQDLARIVLVRGRGGLKFDPKPVQPFGRPYSDPVVRFYNEAAAGYIDPTRLLAKYRQLLRGLGEAQVVEADVKDPIFASRGEGVSPPVKTLNIDALGVQAYLFAVQSVAPTISDRANALRERLERYPLERLPFYLRILEERDWARRDGKPIPFEYLVSSAQIWARALELGKVPESALRRLFDLGTADPLVCSLFFGPPATSPLSTGVEALLAASLREPESFRLWLYKKASSFPRPDLTRSLRKAIGMRRQGGLLFGNNPIAVRSEDAQVREIVQYYNSFLERRPGGSVPDDESLTKALQERERAKERGVLQERYLQLLEEATEKGYAIRGEDLMRIAKASETGDDSTPQIPWRAKNREGAVGVPFVPQDLAFLNVDEVLGIAPEAPTSVKEPWERDELGFALRMGAVDALATKAAERLGLPTGDLSKAVGYALLGVAFDLGGHLGRPGLAKLGGELGPALNVWSAARGVGALSTILESLLPAEAPEDILSGVRMVAEEAGAVTGEPVGETGEGKGRRAQR